MSEPRCCYRSGTLYDCSKLADFELLPAFKPHEALAYACRDHVGAMLDDSEYTTVWPVATRVKA